MDEQHPELSEQAAPAEPPPRRKAQHITLTPAVEHSTAQALNVTTKRISPQARRPACAPPQRRRTSRGKPVRIQGSRRGRATARAPDDDPDSDEPARGRRQPELDEFSCASGAHERVSVCRVCGWTAVSGPLFSIGEGTA